MLTKHEISRVVRAIDTVDFVVKVEGEGKPSPASTGPRELSTKGNSEIGPSATGAGAVWDTAVTRLLVVGVAMYSVGVNSFYVTKRLVADREDDVAGDANISIFGTPSDPHSWSLLECAALRRSSQCGTRGFLGLPPTRNTLECSMGQHFRAAEVCGAIAVDVNTAGTR